MAIPFASIKLAIYNVVRRELDVTTIWADQSEVRPERPYASIRLTSGPIVVGSDEGREPVSGQFTVEGLRQLVMSVQAFGDSAIERMSKLQTALSKDSVVEELDASGIAVYDVGAVQNLTALLENRFETRAQMDLSMYVTDAEVDDTGYIEDVEVTNEVNDDTIVVET